MVNKIISGGQTGADRGGLIAAKNLGITTGGFIPRGFKTELGNEPNLEVEFGLTEFGTTYPQRTLANVQRADATIIFYRGQLEQGSALTVSYCGKRNKPYLSVCLDEDTTIIVQDIIKFLTANNVKVLNVAGNRESKAPGIEKAVVDILTKAIKDAKFD